jgi:hypothetical protein
MGDPLSLENLLELSLAAPCSKLAAVVGEYFTGSAPLADSAFYNLQYSFRRLLAEQTMTNDVA